MSRFRNSVSRAISAGAALLLVGGVVIGTVTPASAATATTLYASPSAVTTGAGTSCATAQYATISAAVAAAVAGDTVVACAGTYTEDVVIPVSLTLVGESATINATGLSGAPTGAVLGQAPYNGITIEASNVTVEGFTVEGAEGEGILAINPAPVTGPMIGGQQLYTGTPLTNVTIENNVVQGNDLGEGNASSPYAYCTPNGGGDCGEGIHLLSVANSTILNNKSMDNSGGILLTDEYGPTDNNLVQGNYVEGNASDCGITLPSHNLGLNPQTKQPEPSFGGVYNNRVLDNQSIDNGVEGFGAGIGVFAPASFTASYDNTISGNLIEGNGLAGISVHSHAANAYVNGNVFTDNTIGENNVDLADGTDSSPQDNHTTGILIWSAKTKYTFTVSGNTIFDDAFGVWYTPKTVVTNDLTENTYSVSSKPVQHAY